MTLQLLSAATHAPVHAKPRLSSVRRSTSNARGGAADSATTVHGGQIHAVASCALQKEMQQVLGPIGTSDNENNHAVYVQSECHFGRHDLKIHIGPLSK